MAQSPSRRRSATPGAAGTGSSNAASGVSVSGRHNPDGATIGLIDTIVLACRALNGRPFDSRDVAEALKTLHADEDVKSVLGAALSATRQLQALQDAIDSCKEWEMSQEELNELMR